MRVKDLLTVRVLPCLFIRVYLIIDEYFESLRLACSYAEPKEVSLNSFVLLIHNKRPQPRKSKGLNMRN